MINQELIDRFLRNECNAEEQDLINKYFDEHPQEWDQFLPEKELQDIDEMSPERMNPLRPDVSAAWLNRVHREAMGVRKLRVLRWMGAAAAACLLLIAGWYLLRPDKPHQGANATGTELAKNDRLRYRNNTNRKKMIRMPDLSTIVLEPGGIIEYSSRFSEEDQRVIWLQGEAIFNVTKDDRHPFLVNSDELLIKVLGTSFKVRNMVSEDSIIVKLYTGKVLVGLSEILVSAGETREKPASKRSTSDKPASERPASAGGHTQQALARILAPGDELSFSRSTMAINVRSFKIGDVLVKAGKKSGTDNGTAAAKRPDWYQFQEQSLSEVLDQLSAYYQADIYYYPSDMENRYFTGRFEQTDSLEKILNAIGLLNHLTIVKQNSRFIIRENH
jgi:ferric-dicitrate binding protein FerR (iron transport regulator)